MPDADFRAYIAAVRALVDALNRASASGLIEYSTLPLIARVDMLTRTLERDLPPPA